MEEEIECLGRFLEEIVDLYAYCVELLERLTICNRNTRVNKCRKITYGLLQSKIKNGIDEIFAETSDN